MIISRYLNREVIRPFLLVSSVLALLMISYSAISYFSDASASIINPQLALQVILAKTVIAFELFIPLSLYITILLGLGKLYAGQEIAALNASGVGSNRIVLHLMPLIVITTLIVAMIAIWVRPWAYAVRYESTDLAERTIDFERIEAGHFYVNEETGATYFASAVADDGVTKSHVFVSEPDDPYTRAIFSEKAYHIEDPKGGPPILVFLNGSAQRLDSRGEQDWALQFNRLTVIEKEEEPISPEFKRKAASTSHLQHSKNAEELAEFEWRITTAPKAFLLAVIAVFLAKSNPRQGKHGKLTLGIFTFFAVHAVSVLSRTWIEHDVLPVWPGLWWVVIALGIIAVFQIKRPV